MATETVVVSITGVASDVVSRMLSIHRLELSARLESIDVDLNAIEEDSCALELSSLVRSFSYRIFFSTKRKQNFDTELVRAHIAELVSNESGANVPASLVHIARHQHSP